MMHPSVLNQESNQLKERLEIDLKYLKLQQKHLMVFKKDLLRLYADLGKENHLKL